MKNPITSELVRERINQFLSTQTTTKKELAEAIGMDVSQLSKMLNNESKIPVDYIEPWAKCLGVEINDLVTTRKIVSKQWVRPHAHIHLDIDVDIDYVEYIVKILKEL